MKTKTNSKRYLVLIIVALISMIGFAEENKKPTITKTFEMSEPGILNSSSSGGGITVSTHDLPEVIVKVFVRKRGRILSPSDPDLDEVLDNYELVINKSGTTITANAKRKFRTNFWNNSGIYFKIIVPQEMSCNISSSGGGVKISGVEGTHNLSSSGGGVKLENTSGNTRAKSSGGGVKAYKHKGNITLSSSGGGVSLEKAKGNVYATSSGGSVKLSDITGIVEASSSGGSVNVSGNCSSVKAKSSGGSVHVNIDGLKERLDLSSSGGGVYATIKNGENLGMDLDLRGGKVNIDLNNFSGSSEKNRINGSVNNGGIPVYMRASGGSVNVSFE